MDVFHDSTRRTDVLKHAQRVCALVQELGAAHLVLIAGIASQRADTAGRSEVAPRLGANDFETFCYTIRALADIASAHELAAGLHPHAGTHLEFEDEIDRLMNAVSDDPVGLVVDTGHSAYAGIDPRALIRQYGDRVIYVHLKDVNPRIREQALQQGLGFWQAYSAGIFCVLGQGLNDFPGIRDSLQAIGYSGWLTVEQDADPQGLSDPLVDARQSLSFLQSIGLAS
jgi:inosose dehydratase